MHRRRAYTSIMDPDDVRAFSGTLKRPFGTKSLRYGIRVLHRNGHIRWIFDRGQASCRRLGNLHFMDGVLLDITGERCGGGFSELPGHLLKHSTRNGDGFRLELHDRTSPLLTALTGKALQFEAPRRRP